ncbi:hypothetical protein [Kordiimonas sp.]|uniref:hypothetical protein n=1 Tax=Kordiimonas sp. TaxID=1970157 RepID=UPI003A90CE97
MDNSSYLTVASGAGIIAPVPDTPASLSLPVWGTYPLLLTASQPVAQKWAKIARNNEDLFHTEQ